MSDRTRALNKAKIGLMTTKGSVFLTTILFSLKFRWAEEKDKCDTAWVDGLNICVDEKFFMGLPHETRMSLLAHEAWHVAFLHIVRQGKRDPKKYNRAADYVINLMLKGAGFTIPSDWLIDNKYKDMSTNEVYDLLDDNLNEQPSMDDIRPGEGSGKDGELSDQELKDLEHKLTDIVVKATTQAKMESDEAGSIPREIDVFIDKLLNPQLPWELLLQNYLHAFSKDDYSFRKCNRRYLPDYYLPSLYSESIDHIAVAIDSSCSVSDEEFVYMLSEINYINENLTPTNMTILNFDTKVQNIHEIDADNKICDLKFTGRGGTDLRPVFKHFENIPPTVLIVFSDLYCSPIQEDPGYPVIWICVNNERASVNFGELIHYRTPT